MTNDNSHARIDNNILNGQIESIQCPMGRACNVVLLINVWNDKITWLVYLQIKYRRFVSIQFYAIRIRCFAWTKNEQYTKFETKTQ